ncbi:nucleotidyltransferase [Pseudomonas sp. R2.Fl]|nr:nucleotidyltransferase [Pseudomonas sp. R2.Fl]
MTTTRTLTERVTASLVTRNESRQWETLIGRLLRRLELDPDQRAQAETDYNDLALQLARQLDVPRHDVHIFPQGSMRTQTTISPQHPVKFDLDLVVKLTGPRYQNPDPEALFAAVGEALKGNEALTGKPEAKRRCWRLPYPNKRYYFDLTPAVRDQTGHAGSSLSVRDPDTRWAPSNPEEFADWFCTHANQRFPFQVTPRTAATMEHATVTPLPDDEIGLDDILRRAVQLMKLHRDTLYRGASESKQAAMPISVIIVTLATHAYAELLARRAREFSSPIEVALALVEAMPRYIGKSASGWRIENPKLAGENFADRWNSDGGERHAEFVHWHARLEGDLEALLYQSHRSPDEDRIRRVFGPAGVEAWKQSNPRAAVLDGLIASGLEHTKTPATPRPGSSNTLG